MKTTRTENSITLTPDRPAVIVIVELERDEPLWFAPIDEADCQRLRVWLDEKPDLLCIVAATLKAAGADIDSDDLRELLER